MNDCKHWACNLKDNTCIDCGTVICPNFLQEPRIVNVKINIIVVRYQGKYF